MNRSSVDPVDPVASDEPDTPPCLTNATDRVPDGAASVADHDPGIPRPAAVAPSSGDAPDRRPQHTHAAGHPEPDVADTPPHRTHPDALVDIDDDLDDVDTEWGHLASDPDDDMDDDNNDDDDPYADYDDLDPVEPVRGRRSRPRRRTVVAEGVSGRVEVDVADDAPGLDPDGSTPSSYDVADHGPDPVPAWLVTSGEARDTDLGVVKTGKEADVRLVARATPSGESCLLAVKTYRSAEHRLFHRDAGYLEGRRTRRSREMRAMAKRTDFGRDLLSGRWAAAEFAALGTLWEAGARVPYPVQLIGGEVMMQFVGDPDGTAAPRLADADATTADLTDLWHDLARSLVLLAELGLTHGDLSPYNLLVHDGVWLIDLPQAVDVIANPRGREFLDRDCANVAGWFARRGVDADADHLSAHLWEVATRA